MGAIASNIFRHCRLQLQVKFTYEPRNQVQQIHTNPKAESHMGTTALSKFRYCPLRLQVKFTSELGRQEQQLHISF